MPNRSTHANDPVIGPLLAEYHRRLKARLVSIQQLRHNPDTDQLRSIFHQLKGSGKSYGYDPITHLAEKAEQALLATNSPQSAAGEIDALLAYIQNIENFPA